ncbi:unnamed protein product [Blepharisma stoltei]|uniref:Uncharacterized protein n=1 Tax=Blepharisma stoltei TaxID=1481888 RepID=A0AAU9JCU9_9CILI|nr:unnamed protein product [Blepharisma stoltei]
MIILTTLFSQQLFLLLIMENQLKRIIECIIKLLNKQPSDDGSLMMEFETLCDNLQAEMIQAYNRNQTVNMFATDSSQEVEILKGEIESTKDEIIRNKVQLKAYEEILKILYN